MTDDSCENGTLDTHHHNATSAHRNQHEHHRHHKHNTGNGNGHHHQEHDHRLKQDRANRQHHGKCCYAEALDLSFQMIRQCFAPPSRQHHHHHARDNHSASHQHHKEADDEHEHLSQIGISFNGGKDSVVMFELIVMAVGIEAVKQTCVFVLVEDGEFEEMSQFRDDYVGNWGISLVHVPARDGMVRALQKLKDDHGMESVLLGTRSDDPSAKWQNGAVASTTSGWPLMMRYCPVWHWTYHQVWSVTLERQLPYCTLYEQGYTSIGSQDSTKPNPELATSTSHLPDSCRATKQPPRNGNHQSQDSDVALRESGERGEQCNDDVEVEVRRYSFRPAWELMDAATERCGRSKGAH